MQETISPLYTAEKNWMAPKCVYISCWRYCRSPFCHVIDELNGMERNPQREREWTTTKCAHEPFWLCTWQANKRHVNHGCNGLNAPFETEHQIRLPCVLSHRNSASHTLTQHKHFYLTIAPRNGSHFHSMYCQSAIDMRVRAHIIWRMFMYIS